MNGELTTLQLSKADLDGLSAVAAELGLFWGQRGNASRLMRLIARREATVHLGEEPTGITENRLRTALGVMAELLATAQAENRALREASGLCQAATLPEGDDYRLPIVALLTLGLVAQCERK